MAEVPPPRSRIMRAIGSRDTRPELAVRRALWRLGYRYRTNYRGLPGRPDIVFSARRIAIFIHGCYWHQHHCQNGRLPRSNPEFWINKFERNKVRDAANRKDLQDQGWKVLVVWECELSNLDATIANLCLELGPPAGRNQLPTISEIK